MAVPLNLDPVSLGQGSHREGPAHSQMSVSRSFPPMPQVSVSATSYNSPYYFNQGHSFPLSSTAAYWCLISERTTCRGKLSAIQSIICNGTLS